MSNAPRIGVLIRDLRRRQDMTQEELALRTERSVDAISQIERDVNSPSIDTLLRISSALGVSASTFFPSFEKSDGGKQQLIAKAIVELERLSDRDLEIAIRQLRAFNE